MSTVTRIPAPAISTAVSNGGMTTEIRSIGSLEAADILAIGYPGQRFLATEHVRYLAQEMLSGTFLPGMIVLARLPDGRQLLMDGQHRLSAIIRSSTRQTLVVTSYDVPSIEEATKLYRRIDRGRGRGLSVIVQDALIQQLTGLTGRQLRTTLTAMPYLSTGFDHEIKGTERESRSADIRVEGLAYWAPEIRLFGQAITDCDNGMRGRIGVGSVASIALVTFRYRAQQAADFWRTVALNDGLKRGTARHTLHQFLMSERVRERGGMVYTRAVASCWNAAFHEKNLQSVSVRDTSLPIMIAGTPYDGKTVVIPSYMQKGSGG